MSGTSDLGVNWDLPPKWPIMATKPCKKTELERSNLGLSYGWLPQYEIVKGGRLMRITESRPEVLIARVKRLELEARIWQIAGLLVLLIFLFTRAGILKAQGYSATAPIRSTTVEAQNFVLKDSSGAVMGQLTVKDGKAQLDLYDGSGKLAWSTNTRTMTMSH